MKNQRRMKKAQHVGFALNVFFYPITKVQFIDESIFDIQSCARRCDEPADGVLRKYGFLIGLCGCDEECENTNSCCPDYKTACSDGRFFN